MKPAFLSPVSAARVEWACQPIFPLIVGTSAPALRRSIFTSWARFVSRFAGLAVLVAAASLAPVVWVLGHVLVQTAQAYLAGTLTALVNGHKQSRIEELMPWRHPA